MVELILLFSVILNTFLMWFGYKLLRKVTYVSENTIEMLDAVDNYKEHLKGVYELETFYGDQTLQSLLEHSRELVSFLQECEGSYSMTEKEFTDYVGRTQDEEETQTQEDEQGRR